jgi:hypothetical protein
MEPGFNDMMHIILSAVFSVLPLWRVWSQFGSQLCPFIGVRERPTDRFASVNVDTRTPLDLGLRIWKAGWVQALAGSNPASSASWKIGSDLRKRRSDQIGSGRRRIIESGKVL